MTMEITEHFERGSLMYFSMVDFYYYPRIHGGSFNNFWRRIPPTATPRDPFLADLACARTLAIYNPASGLVYEDVRN
jgi:hypothetical protein